LIGEEPSVDVIYKSGLIRLMENCNL